MYHVFLILFVIALKFPNCINTNIFKVYEVSEESTSEEKILVTPPQKTKTKIAKGI